MFLYILFVKELLIRIVIFTYIFIKFASWIEPTVSPYCSLRNFEHSIRKIEGPSFGPYWNNWVKSPSHFSSTFALSSRGWCIKFATGPKRSTIWNKLLWNLLNMTTYTQKGKYWTGGPLTVVKCHIKILPCLCSPNMSKHKAFWVL